MFSSTINIYMNKKQYILDNIEKINEKIKENSSLADISKMLHIKQSTLVKHLKEIGINYKGRQDWSKGKKFIKKHAIDYLGDPGKFITNSKLRILLIKDGLKEEKCERCNKIEWMGQKIPLELHHIDGNHFNNTLENLMILCSNCHMQMHGYSNLSLNKTPRSSNGSGH